MVGLVSDPFVAWGRSSEPDDFFRLLVTGPLNAEEDGNTCKVVFLYYIVPEKKSEVSLISVWFENINGKS